MTREEEIKKAARDYVSGDTLTSPSILIHFENGAGWADDNPPQDVVYLNDVWHEVFEKPTTEPTSILATDEKGFAEVYHLEKGRKLRVLNGFILWSSIVFCYKLTKWAYIEDLMPKGGKR